ncbi:MAG: hypothetical protein FWG56_06595 [Desulfovibrionaceae bacterium]|nr:hypothetical protein [Desulfovibrionaceae bacterium]
MTETGNCKPATAADGLSEAAGVSAELFFQGATACGAVGLTLAREAGAEGAVTGIEQVLQLAQAEPLICAVEQWLRSDWDPAPCGSGDEAVHDGYRAMVRDPALAPPGTILHLPLRALLAPLPEILCDAALTWAAPTANLVLGNVPLQVLERLEPGALVWLPQAFGPQWMVRLHDLARRLPTRLARLDLAAQRLEVAAGASAGTPPPEAARPDDDAQPLVRLAQGVPVPLDYWMGLGRADRPFHWPVPQPWAAQLCCAGAVRACGALLPIGQGYGMLLESVQAPAAA